MKKKKYLPLYEKWMENDSVMPLPGLCSNFGNDKLLKIMTPTEDNDMDLCNEMMPLIYWGSGGRQYHSMMFTPLRQTIVLFMAAMNNEL